MSVPIWEALLLGALQGLTEFLPVSSSGHLALVQTVLPGFYQPGILFDVMLHVGTLVAVVVVFRARIGSLLAGLAARDASRRGASWRFAGLLAVSVLATGLLALPFRHVALFGLSQVRQIGMALLVTAAVLALAQVIGSRRGEGGRSLEELGLKDAFLIGLCQSASAVFRGLSRSGNTISVGLFSGLSRRAAAEYSFLLSLPTILAAATVENVQAYRAGVSVFSRGSDLLSYLVGMLVAALVGTLAVTLLLRLVVSMRLWPFVVYCSLLGGGLIVFAG